MEFVQNFTPPDFQATNFTPSISPNFNSFSGKKHKKCVKMEKFTPLAKNITLPGGMDKSHLCLYVRKTQRKSLIWALNGAGVGVGANIG